MDASTDLSKTLERYLTTATNHLDSHGASVDRIVISPSPVTWDGGCDGQLWVRLAAIAPISGITSPQLCGVTYWIATLGLGVIRRISTVGNQGQSPYAEDVTEDALAQAEDARILKDVLLHEDLTRNIIAWNPLQPQGGFAGGEWTFDVRVPNVYRPPGD